MASSKAKAGVLGESGPLKEAKGAGGAPPAGEAAANSRSYSLEELDTVATVGEYRAGLRGPSGPDPQRERERCRGFYRLQPAHHVIVCKHAGPNPPGRSRSMTRTWSLDPSWASVPPDGFCLRLGQSCGRGAMES